VATFSFGFSQKKDSITVYLFLAEDCKICQYYSNTLSDLYQQFNSPHIAFLGLFPNRYSTEKGIQAFKQKFEIPFPLKREFYHSKTDALAATITPEVVVFNESRQSIIYQGRIDDSYVKLGKRQRVVKHHELQEVLTALADNRDPAVANQPAVGCFIMTK
jgi:peroxiredoxin